MLENSALSTLDLQWQAQGFLLLNDKLDLAEIDLSTVQPARLQGKNRGGSRNLLSHPLTQTLLASLRQLPELQLLLPQSYRAIHCTYFEKHAERNWLVAWHQDLSIAMPARHSKPGWTDWTYKEGQWFVRPPIEFLAQCLALRLHLDPCGEHDGALRVLPGTHQLGRLSSSQIQEMQQQIQAQACYAKSGEILLMRPSLLHASSKAQGTSRRRVLHYVFAPELGN